MFSDETQDIIKEVLVFTKLSNGYELRKFEEEFYVLLQGYIVPYRIFVVLLCKYGLWQIRFSKGDWYTMNKDLIDLWKNLDVVPDDVEFDAMSHPKEAQKQAWGCKENKKVPTTVLKRALISLELEEKDEDFFLSRGESTAKYEALLYFLERDYAALAK